MEFYRLLKRKLASLFLKLKKSKKIYFDLADVLSIKFYIKDIEQNGSSKDDVWTLVQSDFIQLLRFVLAFHTCN